MTKYLSFTFLDLELQDLGKHKSYHVVSGGDEMLDTVIVNCTYSRAQLTYSYFKTSLYTSFERLTPPPLNPTTITIPHHQSQQAKSWKRHSEFFKNLPFCV